MIDNILSETICRVYFCALFSNIYFKIKFTAPNGSDLCNFCSKLDFLKNFIRNHFLLFFPIFKLLMFQNSIAKTQKF